MLEVCKVLVDVGQASPLARRQYGQALIELGSLEEALAVLEALATDPSCPPSEIAEARGLCGRAYKQIYVAQQPLPGPARKLTLSASVNAYLGVYTGDRKEYTWQGINAVAMLLRGKRDNITLVVAEDPLRLAEEILGTVSAPKYHWDVATAAEACVALGRWADATRFMQAYVSHPELDSFSAASTLRQLKEVWQIREGGTGGDLVTLLQAAVLSASKPTTAPASEQLSAPLSLGPGDLQDADTALREREGLLEKFFSGDRPRSYEWYQRGIARARAVGRIERVTGEGVGSAFLVRADQLLGSHGSEDELLLLTNSHVMGKLGKKALRADETVVRFEALDARRTFRIKEIVFESPSDELDVTVARLDAAVTGVDPCPLTPATEPQFDARRPSRFFVIGYPGGQRLSLSIEDNLQVGYARPHLHYRTPTEPGNSGSPVFDSDWQLVAIHHAGSDVMRRLDGEAGTYRANEGIWIHAIVQAMAGTVTAESSSAVSAPPARPQRRSGIFISYSHADKQWLEILRTHLAPRLASASIQAWDDRQINVGSNWLSAIRSAVDQASVAILLVSSRFLASDFIRRDEMPRILEASRAQGLTIVPIAIGSAFIDAVPALSDLQFANDPRQPLDQMTPAKADEELVKVVTKISSILDTGGLANTLQAIDAMAYKASGLGGTAPTAQRTTSFGAIAARGDDGLVSVRGNQATVLITFEQVANLPADQRQMIRAFDRTIADHFEDFTEAFGRRGARDPDVRNRALAKMEEARRSMCEVLQDLLRFLSFLRLSLDDHYLSMRYVCAERQAAE
jgi:V8-like Glu-specific endopeptidase